MHSTDFLLFTFATGVPLMAWFARWSALSNRRKLAKGAPLRATGLQGLLLPSISASVCSHDQVEVYLHNRNERSIRFQTLADLLVIHVRSAGSIERTHVGVLEAFFPKADGQAWLEAGATAGPFHLKKEGLKHLEVSYRHVEAHSTVETGRRIIEV